MCSILTTDLVFLHAHTGKTSPEQESTHFACADFCFVHADLTLPLVLPPVAEIISISSVFGIEVIPLFQYRQK